MNKLQDEILAFSKMSGSVSTPKSLSGNVGAKTINIGEDGATFIPSVSEDGVISWANDKGMPNPEPVNIKGEKGDKGDRGERGLQGVQGERGEQGQKGEKGDKGDRGEQGVQGLKGEKGDTGAQGEKGDKGDTGEPGKDGQPGKDGVDGQPGKDGSPGKDGADGKSAYAYAQDGGYTGSEAEFAEKLAKEPLIGTTNETTSLDVFGALLDGRPVTLLHDGGELGSLLFSNFAYSEMFHAVVASTVVNIGGMSSCVQLFGEVQVLEPKEWQFSVTPIPTQENIQTSVGEALEQAKESGEFNGEDGEDGFSPAVAVEDIAGGHRVTITDKDGDKAFDVMDGTGGEGGSGGNGGANADWNAAEGEPGHVLNRTHYAYTPPSIFWTKENEQEDSFDASALGLGVFRKFSDEVLDTDYFIRSRDKGNNIVANRSDGERGYCLVNGSMMYNESVGELVELSFINIDSSINSLFVFSAYTAVDLTDVYGFVIPSPGLYAFIPPQIIDFIIDIEFGRFEIIKKIDAKFLYEDRLTVSWNYKNTNSISGVNLWDEEYQAKEIRKLFNNPWIYITIYCDNGDVVSVCMNKEYAGQENCTFIGHHIDTTISDSTYHIVSSTLYRFDLNTETGFLECRATPLQIG